MSEPDLKRPRITPRNSTADQDVLAAANVTPFNDLHQLGKIIRRPNTPRQHINISLPSSRVATPGTASRTPSGNRSARPTPARRGAPTTPHALRAQAANNQRRNVVPTPSRDRRRSGRLLRETPRDDLRKLSKVMAKHTKPIDPSPDVTVSRQASRAAAFREDDDDSPRLQDPPRLSMSRKDLDDDSFHEAPPRMSVGLDDDDDDAGTAQSLEEGRRALLNRQRLARESFGALQLSERFADINELGYEDEAMDGFAAEGIDDEDLLSDEDIRAPMENETTRDLRILMDDAEGDVSTRQSMGTDGDPTFMFRIPEASRLSMYREASRLSSMHDVEEPPPAEDSIPQLEADVVPIGSDGEGDSSLMSENNDIGAFDDEEVDIALDEQASPDTTLHRTLLQTTAKLGPNPRPPKELRKSRLGIEYPSLPTAVVKKVASAFARSSAGTGRLSKDTIAAISEASDWFLEQISDDLATYSAHAKRKTIDESDVVTLMKRQRRLNSHNTIFSLAQKSLPRELLQEIRMPPPPKTRGKKRSLETITEEAG